MFGDFALRYGINCIGDLRHTEVLKKLNELLHRGKIDISYPVIYRKPENGRWYMVVLRRDDYPLISRDLFVSSKKEAVAKVEELFQPIFAPQCVDEDFGGVNAEERSEIEDLREYYPEIDRWTDRTVKCAWNLYARVIQGSGDYRMSSVLRKYPRDEAFLDYLWHFKVLGDGKSFPYALKNKVGKFLADEVAVWRKWKRSIPVKTYDPRYD